MEIKTKDELSLLLNYSMIIGSKLLENGAEISRVESTITYICKSYNVQRINVYSLTNVIYVTIGISDDCFVTNTITVKSNNTNLDKIAKLNELSRFICTNKPGFEEIKERINLIDKENHKYYKYLSMLGGIVACFCFAIFFGGDVYEALVAALVGFLMSMLIAFNEKFLDNKLIGTFLVSAIGGFVATLICTTSKSLSVSYVIIGAIMISIPGMAIGTSFKDFLMGDILSGLLRLTESVLKALIIAVGFAVPMYLFKKDFTIDPANTNLIVKIITGIFASIGFSFLYHINLKNLIWTIIGAAIVCVTSTLLSKYTDLNVFVITTISALLGVIYAEIIARIRKLPAISITMPAIIVLAPGSLIYRCITSYINKYTQVGNNYLKDTFLAAIGIGSGIALGTFIVLTVLKIYKFFTDKIINRSMGE